MWNFFVKIIVDSLDLYMDFMPPPPPQTKELTSLTLPFYIAVY